MNILVVSQYYYPEPLRINEICEELVNRENEVTVLTTNPNYPDGEIYDGYKNERNEELINGVKVIRCKSRPRHSGNKNLALSYISFAKNASKEIEKINARFDIVYVYQLSPITSCIPAILYKKKYKVPMVLYCLDIWPESLKGSVAENGIIYKACSLLSKYVYESSDKLTVTSPSFVSYISDLCKIDEEQIDILPQHSIDIVHDLVIPKKTLDSKDVINFVFIGNIGESQNIECIIESLNYVKNIDRLVIHFVGSGSYLEESIALSEKSGFSSHVIFHGRHPKSEMANFYIMADVCIVSLKDEGIVGYTIPGKLQEYMAAGKPILACINGDTTNVIQQAECGVCTIADDRKQLAKGIDYMIENSDKLATWGKNARKYYEENYTLKIHVDRLEDILLKELNNR